MPNLGGASRAVVSEHTLPSQTASKAAMPRSSNRLTSLSACPCASTYGIRTGVGISEAIIAHQRGNQRASAR